MFEEKMFFFLNKLGSAFGQLVGVQFKLINFGSLRFQIVSEMKL